MDSSSRLVIKVKYGDVLRRFDALITEDELILTMDVLERKILSLFALPLDTELILTYVDEDDDVVNLVDDDDIYDVLSQGLNPLRITVAVSAEKSGKRSTHSRASSSHLSSPPREQVRQYLQTGVSEILGTLPEPVRDSFVTLSTKLACKASSTPGFSGLLGSFAEMGMFCLDQLLESHTINDLERFRVDLVPLPSVEAPEPSKNIESLEKVEPQAVNRSNEVKIPAVAGGSVGGISTFDSTAVAAALDSMTTHASKPSNYPLPNPGPLPLHISPGLNKEKVKKTIETTPLSAVPKKEKTKKTIETTLPSSAAGKPELSDGPTKSCLQQVPRLLMGPFSGTALGNASYVPPNSASKSVFSGWPVLNYGNQKTVHNGVCCDCCDIKPIRGPRFKSKVKDDYDLCSTCFEKMGNDNDYIRMDFPAFYGLHNGVCCDGCDIQPIRGPRFKSKVKENYDLCSTCFEKMGNDNDYIRMDFPAVYGLPCRGITCHAQDQGRGSTLPHAYHDCPIKPVAIKLDSFFVKDVTIFDDTVMAPSTPFTKIWQMRNNGTVAWLQGTQLVWTGGAKMSNMLSVKLNISEDGVWMGQELNVKVDFISPNHPGRYISYWRMATPTGEMFGQRVWVLIQVKAFTNETQHENVRNLNLNLTPESYGLACSEVFKVDPEPMVVGSNPEPDHPKKQVDLLNPIIEQDLKFPINNNLLVGNGALSPALSSTSALHGQPISFFTPVRPLPSYCVAPGLFSLPSSEVQPEASGESSCGTQAQGFQRY